MSYEIFLRDRSAFAAKAARIARGVTGGVTPRSQARSEPSEATIRKEERNRIAELLTQLASGFREGGGGCGPYAATEREILGIAADAVDDLAEELLLDGAGGAG